MALRNSEEYGFNIVEIDHITPPFQVRGSYDSELRSLMQTFQSGEHTGDRTSNLSRTSHFTSRPARIPTQRVSVSFLCQSESPTVKQCPVKPVDTRHAPAYQCRSNKRLTSKDWVCHSFIPTKRSRLFVPQSYLVLWWTKLGTITTPDRNDFKTIQAEKREHGVKDWGKADLFVNLQVQVECN